MKELPISQELQHAALKYHEAGFRVIPIEPGGKRPLVRWRRFWQVGPTTAQIRNWWHRTPNANVAVLMDSEHFAVMTPSVYPDGVTYTGEIPFPDDLLTEPMLDLVAA